MKRWLIAYDIKNPRRLRKIHRLLKNWGIPLQKSLFMVKGTQNIIELREQLKIAMDQNEDDIRLYPIYQDSLVWKWDKSDHLEGILLC